MFGWLRSKPAPRETTPWDPQTPLIRWDSSGNDVLTLGDSYENVLITGRTGSGKSSTSGKMIALAQLEAGFGGLVLTVKPGEAAMWREQCRQTGRLEDLRVVDFTANHRFNFLQELQSMQGDDAGLTENIVSLLMEVGQIGSRQTSASAGQGDNAFFQQACRTLLRNCIDLLILAEGEVSVSNLCRLVSALPKSMDQVRSEDWRKSSPCYRLLTKADQRAFTPRQQRDYEAVLDYVMCDFPSLADRTRSSITATFMAFADLFQRGLLHNLLSTDTTLSPREIEDGKIIVIDLPLKVTGEVGLTAQLVWKLMAQRILERRAVTSRTRPAFIHIDEAQFFASGQSDALFATTCRSARVSLILLTQSISGFVTAFGGGDMGQALTDQLLANLSTKIIHATGDTGTAEWAAELCGRDYRMLCNMSNSAGGTTDWAAMAGIGGNGQATSGLTESLQYEIEPREFAYLRTGGARNSFLADAILIRSGVPFTSTGRTWRPITLSQK
ncbi:type IV secretory system conjugative DNA transfer family protein [Humisphaera borealis]|uniref:TraM recognition domain-containing protein n=1 Tax=Humisphaera borealis TaxID=2807512 RepID=A0A7M2X4V5_9BACT|nr:TraM recognition domain-containing protein [Humisphaera borealis]QOV92081.1 TraM recognition domain-containing protein [Humisphaera borealis]